MNEEAKTSILQMARGAIQERIDYEMAKVIDNILDPNTSTQKKRKLTLTIELQPDDNRQTVFVNCTVKSALCPTNQVSTSLHHWRWRYWRSGSRGNGAQCSGAAGYVRRRAGSRADFEDGKKCIRRKKNAEKCN